MSDTDPPHGARPRPSSEPDEPLSLPPQRGGCLAAIMVMVGLVLLLPGLCVLLLTYGTIGSLRFDQLWGNSPIIIVALVLAGFGIWLIRKAAS